MMSCMLCNSKRLTELLNRQSMAFVTSDAKPASFSVDIFGCLDCGHIQKPQTSQWQEETRNIYEEYSLHSIPGGEVQLSFDSKGQAEPRAKIVANLIKDNLSLPDSGKMLDFGCGDGAFLRYFSEICDKWELYGLDMAPQFRKLVLSNKGVRSFYSDIAEVDADLQFDLITLHDVLEHLPNPVEMLASLKNMLAPDGVIFVRSPNFTLNPFDLIIADHCSHFTEDAIRYLSSSVGLSYTKTQRLPKENGFFARREEKRREEKRREEKRREEKRREEKRREYTFNASENIKKCEAALNWLQDLLRLFRGCGENLGVLGCSIAGVWVAETISGNIDFFVDEDPKRRGDGPLGLPVIGMDNVKAGAKILLPFPPQAAAAVHARLSQAYTSVEFVLPPLLDIH